MTESLWTAKARDIIATNLYITIATATSNGTPWISPVYSAHDRNYTFYWFSAADAQHSRLIRQNSNVALVIFNSQVPEGTGEGVYARAHAFELAEPQEVGFGLDLIYTRINKTPPTPDDFLGRAPRRVYKAVPDHVWMNIDADVDGHLVDRRVEVDLLQG